MSLDGVVAVVDAANVARQLAEARAGGAANEAQLQVAMADVVLVNKVRRRSGGALCWGALCSAGALW